MIPALSVARAAGLAAMVYSALCLVACDGDPDVGAPPVSGAWSGEPATLAQADARVPIGFSMPDHAGNPSERTSAPTRAQRQAAGSVRLNTSANDPVHTRGDDRQSAGNSRRAAGSGDSHLPFDYWVLSLSWSPEYCAKSQTPNEMQCVKSYAFVVHGLWPQYETGYPRNCDADGRSRRVDPDLVDAMLPIMPSPKLIQHEWRAHGLCSGMNADTYFATTRKARQQIQIPPVYSSAERPHQTTLRDIESEFIQMNPGLERDAISFQCASRNLSEVRICLDKHLQFRDCGRDVRDRCKGEVRLRPNR
jgi:ribonuclease T2